MLSQATRRVCWLTGKLRHWSSSNPVSTSSAIINVPPQKYTKRRNELSHNSWREKDASHERSLETHLSNAQILIHKVPVIYSNHKTVRCLGGAHIGSGHPQVYIQLDTRQREPVSCKYCGLRYALAHHH